MTQWPQLPLKYLLPLLLSGFALLIGTALYWSNRSLLVDSIEQRAQMENADELNQLQGVLQLLLSNNDLEGARRVVAATGSVTGHRMTLLTAADGTILAATRLAAIGMSWRELDSRIDRELVDRLAASGGTRVQLALDGQAVIGYAEVCISDPSRSLRSRDCGFLYHRYDLGLRKAIAQRILLRQLLTDASAVLAAAVLLWLILHFLLTRRLQRLVNTAQAFATGDSQARAGVGGHDELAVVGTAFDTMLDTVVDNQQALSIRNRALEASNNGIVISDNSRPGNPVIYANPAFERITGYTAAEIAGKNCRLLQNGDTDQPELAAIRTALQTCRPINVTLRNYRKDGSLFWNDLHIAPVYSPEGDITHYVGVMNDISERKRISIELQQNYDLLDLRVRQRTAELAQRNRQLNQEIAERKHIEGELRGAKEEAEAANQTKSRFLAAASHDLRQPLQTIRTLQGILARSVTGQQAQQPLAALKESVQVMDDILGTLLDINQLETGSIQPDPVDFPAAVLFSRIRSEFSYPAQDKGLELRIRPGHAILHSDLNMLLEIIRNLVSNAITYTETGKVLVGYRRRGHCMRIEVWDNGPGIPKDQQQAIFEEFYQLDNPARERRHGLGLGLSIVKRLAGLLEHDLDLCSIPGKGSVFSITVPFGSSLPEAAQSAETGPVYAAPAKQQTILYVEDDPAILDAMQMLLRLEGFHVVPAQSGRSALEQIEQNRLQPDLVISDYQLPAGMDGSQVIEELRHRLGYPIPAIIITGDVSDRLSRTDEVSGLWILYKPVDEDLLLRTMAQALQRT